MSDTPRTDALLDPKWLERGMSQHGASWGWGTLTQARDLCRQLERERNQMEDRVRRLIDRANRLQKAGDAYTCAPCYCIADGPCEHTELYMAWEKAKEAQP